MNNDKRCKLWLGDCMALMQEIPNNSVDLILCDPPYGITKNDYDVELPLDGLWKEYSRVCKPHSAILMFSQMPYTAKLVSSNLKNFRYEWIWQKTKSTGFMNAKKMPLKSHENICVFYEKLPTYNPQGVITGVRLKTGRSRKGNSRNYGKTGCGNPNYIQTTANYPKDIVCFSNPSSKGHLHPNQKPVELIEYFILTYTNKDEVILDNCAGSMTTAVAALNTERKCVCIEKQKNYFEDGLSRVAEHLKYLGLPNDILETKKEMTEEEING